MMTEQDRWNDTVASAQWLYQMAQSPTVLSGDHRPRVVESLSYEKQKRLFDRFHRGKEYVVDGVIHRGQ